jgi:antitoxin ParD1/3/4
MEIELTPEHEDMIRQKVESGLYNDANEVICDALLLMEEHDRNAEDANRPASPITPEF